MPGSTTVSVAGPATDLVTATIGTAAASVVAFSAVASLWRLEMPQNATPAATSNPTTKATMAGSRDLRVRTGA